MRYASRLLCIVISLLAIFLPVQSFADEPHGIDPRIMDRSADPITDFYRYANGKWLDKAQIPPNRPFIGVWQEVRDRVEKQVKKIIEKAAKDEKADTETLSGKIGLFYRVGMNQKRAEHLGTAPLTPLLAQIDAISNVTGILETIASHHTFELSSGFTAWAAPDPKNNAQVIAQLSQGGLGLPDRDYYFKTDAPTQMIRTAYQEHIVRSMELMGESKETATKSAETVMVLETRLANASKTNVEMRDPNSLYHKVSLAELDALTPGVQWEPYFAFLGNPDPGPLNIATPEFYTELGKMLVQLPLVQWKTYLRWSLVRVCLEFLNKACRDEDFRFASILTGQKQPTPRPRQVLLKMQELLDFGIGQLWAAEAFPPEAKQRALALVQNVKAVLRERIAQLDWMSEATKTQALRKLDTIIVKIGYPDVWRDYSTLHLTDDYITNLIRAAQYDFRYNWNKIGKPVDKTEWNMSPQTVDAMYNSFNNDITFPAGDLQPPFFDPKADDACNYGALGMGIGHEITHGFDDQGRQFDAEGNLQDWWTPEDAARYKAVGAALIAQYNGYTAVDDLKINGALTLGENIADLGGLTIAWLAYQKSLEGKPEPPDKDGLTDKQRFFVAFGQKWRRKIAPASIRLMIATDPHSPPMWRVTGVLANMPAFYEAFGKPVPADIKRIW